MPTAYLIAGPDGAGKVTFARGYSIAIKTVCGTIASEANMSHRGNKLLKEVMGLSLADRQVLIEEVLESIDDDTFKAELKRRRDEYLADKSCSVPWTAIFDDEKAHAP